MEARARRQFLYSAAGTVTVLAAGCLSSSSATVEPDDLDVRRVDAASHRSVPTLSNDAIETTDLDPFVGLGVGDERTDEGDDPPHCVWVWNGTESRRELTLDLELAAGDVFSRTFDFASESSGGVVLFTPAEYTVAVSGPNWRQTVSIPDSRFDCNASATDVVVVEPGQLNHGTVTTDMECG